MSALTGIIPGKHRKTAYAIFAVIGVVVGAVQTAFIAGDVSQPAWLTVAIAVYGYLGGAIGATAGSNIHEAATPGAADAVG